MPPRTQRPRCDVADVYSWLVCEAKKDQSLARRPTEPLVVIMHVEGPAGPSQLNPSESCQSLLQSNIQPRRATRAPGAAQAGRREEDKDESGKKNPCVVVHTFIFFFAESSNI